MTFPLAASAHPSAEALELFEHGGLGPSELSDVGEHVECCAACREQLSQLRSSDFALTTGLALETQALPSEARPGGAPSPARWLPTRAEVMRSLDPSSRFLPVSAVVGLVGVLIPALWIASSARVS